MEIFTGIGVLWIVMGVVFVWMFVQYGMGVGKQYEVKREMKELENEEAAKHPDVKPSDRATQKKKVS
jgi:hypothetical protein